MAQDTAAGLERAPEPRGGRGGDCQAGGGVPSLVKQSITRPNCLPVEKTPNSAYSVVQRGHNGSGEEYYGGQNSGARRLVGAIEEAGESGGDRLYDAGTASAPGKDGAAQKLGVCPDGSWLRGSCEHGASRWVRVPCKRRGCPVCGELRRRLIAWRIAEGIDALGQGQGGAWFVGTFAKDVAKADAVKILRQFIKWLRKELGYRVEYAATWEVTRAGRLHLNLVLAPWRYIPQKALSRAWRRVGGGPVVWVQRVGGGVGVEAAKAREGIGGYLGKWEQMVKSGRGVAYSKGWPKLPENAWAGRRGEISWRWVGGLGEEAAMFGYERDLGYWREVAPGEWAEADGETCDCFERPP